MKALEEFEIKLTADAVNDPAWDKTGKVHDWKNHIGTHTRRIWHTLSPLQKLAIAADADENASAELWD